MKGGFQVCIIPFHKPSIVAITPTEQEAFDDLDELLNEGSLSGVLGWLVRQHSVLTDTMKIKQMKLKLSDYFSGRSLSNWALLLLCTQQVCHISIPIYNFCAVYSYYQKPHVNVIEMRYAASFALLGLAQKRVICHTMKIFYKRHYPRSSVQ